ncbi:MAG: anaerobic ribonucleoside-triphosphate reductase [Candidatus Thermoplasmatota archaeon]|nr:anaerobic ribonucleoside-triphosphate reductase [Candidatus Thermoplasmatota archaeon]
MKVEEFKAYLKVHESEFGFEPYTHEGVDGILVSNKLFSTRTHFSRKAIEENDILTLLNATHQGKNIDQITRITGYFSQIRSWNKGKTGELKDRYRNKGYF